MQTCAKKSYCISFAVFRFYRMLKIGAKNGIISYVSGKFRHLWLFHLKTTGAGCSIGVYFMSGNNGCAFMVWCEIIITGTCTLMSVNWIDWMIIIARTYTKGVFFYLHIQNSTTSRLTNTTIFRFRCCRCMISFHRGLFLTEERIQIYFCVHFH